MLSIFKFVGLWLCRILFAVEYHGLENIPDKGAVIVAGNHPSYLDPVLVMLPLSRPIRYMAWDALFKIPGLGQAIRMLGAFPVDIRRGKGESAFNEAINILHGHEALGIFPEGQRSERGPMGELRTGVARLAIATGAPIVPVTIGGASRAWPKYRMLPRPAKIIVRYHAPIHLDPTEREQRGADREYHLEVMQSLANRINRSLTPTLRGAEAWERWYHQPPSHLRTYEWVPLVAAFIVTLLAYSRRALSENWLGLWLPLSGYYLYLIADLVFIKPCRTAKWLRNSMPVWLMLIWHGFLVSAAGLLPGKMNLVLAGGGLTAFFLFFYESYYMLQKFVRGLVVVYYLSLLLLLRWPEPRGVLIGVLLFIAIFGWWFKVIYSRMLSAVMLLLLAIVLCVTWPLSVNLIPYVVLAILAVCYLQTFVHAAYDIRRAGEVSMKH